MIKQCSVEIFGEGKIATNYFNLNDKSLAKLKLIDAYDPRGVYEDEISRLKEIVANTDIIFLRNPENMVGKNKIAYQALLEVIKDPLRMRPYSGSRDSIRINYNQPPTEIDTGSITFNMNEGNMLDTATMWHNAFLYSFVRIHNKNSYYMTRADSSFTSSSDADIGDFEKENIMDKFYTVKLLAYEHRCAYYLIPVRLFVDTNTRIHPLRFFEGRRDLRNIGYASTFDFLIEKEHFSVDLLKKMKEYGSLVGGTALHQVSESDVGGFNYTNNSWLY